MGEAIRRGRSEIEGSNVLCPVGTEDEGCDALRRGVVRIVLRRGAHRDHLMRCMSIGRDSPALVRGRLWP